MRRNTTSSRFRWLLGALCALWLLWPASLGGQAQFIVVQGTSMEPEMHNGDLLYVRSTTDYQPGDVAVYRMPDGSPAEGRLIVHRIIAAAPDGFTFQGDNRTTSDHIRPLFGDLAGRPVANLGQWPMRLLLTGPLIGSTVVAIAVVWMLWPTRVSWPLQSESPSR